MIDDWADFSKAKRMMGIRSAETFGTDLIEAMYQNCCCGECAKLRGRWFSISGKDTRYPKLPEDYQCECVGLNYRAIFEYSHSIFYGKDADMIKISNRPFVDDRGPLEIEAYNIRKLKHENELFWADYDYRWSVARRYDHQQYDLLVKYMPDFAPKSYSGYMRMKKGNTVNFQKLADAAKEKGIFLEYPADILIELELLEPMRKRYIETLSEVHRREIALEKMRLKKSCPCPDDAGTKAAKEGR